MKKLVFITVILLSSVTLVAQTNKFYYSNDTANELFVDSLAMFIKIDSIKYDTVVNRFKDYFNLQGEKIGYFDDDYAVSIESNRIDTMTIADICNCSNIDTLNIEFWSNGYADLLSQRVWVRNELVCKLDTSSSLNDVQSIIDTYSGDVIEVDKWNRVLIGCNSFDDAY